MFKWSSINGRSQYLIIWLIESSIGCCITMCMKMLFHEFLIKFSTWNFHEININIFFLAKTFIFVVFHCNIDLFIVILVFCIPQRVIMSIMCFLAIAIAYVMRVCLSVAITEMVKKVNQTETSHKGFSICPADPSSSGNSSSSVINNPIKCISFQ